MRRLLLLTLLLGCEQLFPPGPIDPNPPPIIVTDVAWAIVLEETSQRTPETALILADDEFWRAHKISLRPYDLDSPDAAGYVAATSTIARPTLLLLDGKGAKLTAMPLPSTVDGVASVLKGIGR
jgi:hypothetical protein